MISYLFCFECELYGFDYYSKYFLMSSTNNGSTFNLNSNFGLGCGWISKQVKNWKRMIVMRVVSINVNSNLNSKSIDVNLGATFAGRLFGWYLFLFKISIVGWSLCKQMKMRKGVILRMISVHVDSNLNSKCIDVNFGGFFCSCYRNDDCDNRNCQNEGWFHYEFFKGWSETEFGFVFLVQFEYIFRVFCNWFGQKSECARGKINITYLQLHSLILWKYDLISHVFLI